jgi:hypothetical protein
VRHFAHSVVAVWCSACSAVQCAAATTAARCGALHTLCWQCTHCSAHLALCTRCGTHGVSTRRAMHVVWRHSTHSAGLWPSAVRCFARQFCPHFHFAFFNKLLGIFPGLDFWVAVIVPASAFSQRSHHRRCARCFVRYVPEGQLEVDCSTNPHTHNKLLGIYGCCVPPAAWQLGGQKLPVIPAAQRMVSNVFLVASCWGGGTGQLCVQQLALGRPRSLLFSSADPGQV